MRVLKFLLLGLLVIAAGVVVWIYWVGSQIKPLLLRWNK